MRCAAEGRTEGEDRGRREREVEGENQAPQGKIRARFHLSRFVNTGGRSGIEVKKLLSPERESDALSLSVSNRVDGLGEQEECRLSSKSRNAILNAPRMSERKLSRRPDRKLVWKWYAGPLIKTSPNL